MPMPGFYDMPRRVTIILKAAFAGRRRLRAKAGAGVAPPAQAARDQIDFPDVPPQPGRPPGYKTLTFEVPVAARVSVLCHAYPRICVKWKSCFRVCYLFKAVPDTTPEGPFRAGRLPLTTPPPRMLSPKHTKPTTHFLQVSSPADAGAGVLRMRKDEGLTVTT